MKLSVDWKYGAALLVAIAGVGVPIILWQVDQVVRSLKLEVVSQTALNPVAKSMLPDLKLLLEGQELSDPYLTVFELTNNGSRPILSADFESPIQILSDPSSRIIRVDVGDVTPKDLKPLVGLNEREVLFQPLLLNPADMVRLTVLSVGGRPQFDVRSRIAGITKVTFNAEERGNRIKKSWLSLVVGLLLYASYIWLIAEFISGVKDRRFDYESLVIGLVCCFGSVILTKPLRPDSLLSSLTFMVIVLGTSIMLVALKFYLRRKVMSRTAVSFKASHC